MSELTELFNSENRVIDILSPLDGEPFGLKVELRPPEAKERKAAERELQREGLARRGKLTPEKLERNSLTLLYAGVAGWHWGNSRDGGQLTFEGKVPEFTEENFRKVMKKFAFIRNQIDREISDEASFFQNSDKPSET